MKQKEEVRLSTIRMLKAAMQMKAIEKKVKALADEEVLDVIQKQVKQRKDSIAEYDKGNRRDLAEKEQKEIDVLITYLPKQLSKDELKQIVQGAITVTGATTKADIGKLMKEIMPKVKGKADGKEVNQLISELLP